MTIDFSKLIISMVSPLIINPDDLKVVVNESNNTVTIKILANESDLGRIIGKGGKIASSIRSIAYAAGSKEGKHIQVDIDHN
ncbi:MAG: KH domain-containing protein [Acholeplasmatales bacterium]|jgi:predicted RNA-binding protein YlqC (UPF0109 family)|nr:KH domain-containing protein [Acholeplasmatales bacterium]